MPPLGLAKGGHKFFKGGQCPPPRGGREVPLRPRGGQQKSGHRGRGGLRYSNTILQSKVFLLRMPQTHPR